MRSIQSQCFEGRLANIAVEDRVDVLKDIRGKLEDLALVRNRDECAFCAVVHSDLERLGQRTHRLNVALDAHVAKN